MNRSVHVCICTRAVQGEYCYSVDKYLNMSVIDTKRLHSLSNHVVHVLYVTLVYSTSTERYYSKTTDRDLFHIYLPACVFHLTHRHTSLTAPMEIILHLLQIHIMQSPDSRVHTELLTGAFSNLK